MKKIVLTIIGLLGTLGIICLIFIPREQLQKINFPFIKNKEINENMGLISYNLPDDYKNGYFYLKFNENNKNIMYFDYETKKEVYLCNKPNCKHDNSDCSSYSSKLAADELFYHNEALYLINSSASTTTISASFDGTINENSGPSTTIYKMNLDGTEKQKIFTAPSGTSMSIPLVIKDNTMYGYLEEKKVERNKSNYFNTKLIDKKLIAINMETGKHEEIKKGMYESIIGIYDKKLVIEEINYLKDPETLEDNTNAYINNLYNSKIKLKLLDLETRKEEVIYEDIYKNMEQKKVYKNGIYFIGENSKNLEYLDFSTMKKENIIELPQSKMELGTIIDNKLIIYTYKNKDAQIAKSYYIDLNNKEINNFTLKDSNGYLIDILSSNEDYYFVKLDNILGKEYITWAGTKQQELLGAEYGLIKKSDYWNSNAKYIKMENAK